MAIFNQKFVEKHVTSLEELNLQLEAQRDELIAKNAQLENQKLLLITQSKQAAMGEMLSMIAHQWRQPITTLAAILGKIKIKYDLDMLTPEDIEKDHNSAKSVLLHLSKTIDIFQDYFKEKDGTKVLVSELFESAFSIIEPILVSYDINLIVNYDKTIDKKTHVIDDRLDRVVLNIYQNATDALRENSALKNKAISINVRKNKKNETVITISDNAGGIPEAIMDDIFTPYFSTKSKNGTGLGLYMSKDIVENQIGGTLKAYNNLDSACFEIKLSQ
jgi:signal transduction histidine kinase